MKTIDIATDHELLEAILQFQLLTLEYVVATCFPYAEKKERDSRLSCAVSERNVRGRDPC